MRLNVGVQEYVVKLKIKKCFVIIRFILNRQFNCRMLEAKIKVKRPQFYTVYCLNPIQHKLHEFYTTLIEMAFENIAGKVDNAA